MKPVKRIAALLLIVLALSGLAKADGAATAIAGQAQVLYASDRNGQVTSLTDDSLSTVWFCPATYNPKTDNAALTLILGGSTVREIWVRNGNQFGGNYNYYSRPEKMAVTLHYGGSQSVTYRYRMADDYAPTAVSRDWNMGYQRMLLPKTFDNVYCIEFDIESARNGSVAGAAITDIIVSSGLTAGATSAPMPTATPRVQYVTPTPRIEYVSPTPYVPVVTPTPRVEYIVTGTPQVHYVTATPQPAPQPTFPADYTTPSGVMATINARLGTRTGPGTEYDYAGSFFQAGAEVKVLTKVWDPSNGLYWLQVEFTYKKQIMRAYCVDERVNVNLNLIPEEPAGIRAIVVTRTPNYYGPGADCRAHTDKVKNGKVGKIFARENGYVLFEWHDSYQDCERRAWIPESTVQWPYE